MNKTIFAAAVLGAISTLASAQSPLGRDIAHDAASEAARQAPAVFKGDAPKHDSVHLVPDEQPGHKAYTSFTGNFAAIASGRQYDLDYRALSDVGDPFKGGLSAYTNSTLGYAGKQIDHTTQYYRTQRNGLSAGASFNRRDIEGDSSSRVWGMSVGFETGLLTVRAAHQNRQVANIKLYDHAGNNLDAKNSLLAANLKLGWGTAYAAYSASRGWGSSPLFNPDNPYGAGMAATPSTDSRDVLTGIAVPLSHATTLLASFIRKNDRDLANRDANQLALGASYTLSRCTDFYAAYSHIRNAGGAGLPIISTRATTSALNVGMRHAF